MRINPNKMRINPTTPPEPYIPWRTREEAWAEFVQKAEAARRSPWWIEQCRIAFEANQPPWCWEEYLPDGAAPFATETEVKATIDEVIAEHGGKPVGEPRLWPAVRGKLARRGLRVRQKQVRLLMPRRSRGAPRRNS